MLHWLLKKKISPGFYAYHQGLEYHSDAEEMVFNQKYSNPALFASGVGIRAGAMMVTQQPQIYFTPQSIKTGMPTIAGAFTLQPLVGDGTNGI